MAGRVVTVTPSDATHYARAVFTWSSDGQECEVSSMGFSDKEINKLMRKKAHEGANVAGFVVVSR